MPIRFKMTARTRSSRKVSPQSLMTAPKPFVFVLMPFSSTFADIYRFGIKGAVEEVGAYSERIDEQMFGSGTRAAQRASRRRSVGAVRCSAFVETDGRAPDDGSHPYRRSKG